MKGSHITKILIYGLVGIMLAISVVSFVAALSWLNKPFPGFLVYTFPYVGSYSLKEWPSRQAGLKFMDRIVAVDGRPVFRGKDIYQIIKGKQQGTPIRYLVESKGKTGEITLPVTLFTFKDLLLTFGTIFPCGLVLCLLSFIVIVLKPNMASSWIFAGLGLTLAGYLISGLDSMTSHILVPMHFPFASMYPFANFHLALVFPIRKPILRRFPALEYLVYVPSFILTVAWLVYIFTFPKFLQSHGLFASMFNYPLLGSVTRLFLFFSVLGFVVLILGTIFKDKSVEVRQRARVILIGLVIGFLPPVALMLGSHILRLDPTWNFLPFLVIFFPASIAYSIVRHNLFDSDVMIRRTVGYVVVTAVVVGAYVLVSIFFNVFLGRYQISHSRAFPIVFTLIIILIFNPLRNRIQSLVDRVFFRKECDYGEIIHRIGGAMASLLDLGQILKQMVGTFMEDLFINTSSVMLLNPAKTEYQVCLADGERRSEVEKAIFKKEEPLIQIIEKEKKELTKYDVLEDPRYQNVCEGCAKNFETVSASLMVPLVFQDEVIGVINLGEKKSGKAYNREDIDLLRTLANQGAVAIENARLADQMRNEEAVRANLARYLSPQIVEQVIKKNVQVNLGGDRKVVTVLFSDIRNFTRISESLPPDKLVELLNEYFTEMARIIFENQGSLDKYIGDAIVAVFGSLIPLENPGRTAVQAAIQMMKELSSLNQKWKDQYGFRMDIGIGINTGEVFLGNIGSPERMEFTVIGDTVNTASRFSDVAKAGQILVTKETLLNLGPEIKYTELPPAEVKGKTGKLEVFEILY